MTRIVDFLRRHWMWLPVLVALANSLHHHFWSDLSWISPDAPSYFHSWELWSSGRFDCFRTPLYPLFLGAVHAPFPDGDITPRLIVILIQNILYLISVYTLALIAHKGLRLPVWATLTSLIPYCVPALFVRYACNIITDGPATALLIFFVWQVIQLVRHPSAARGAVSATMLIILVSLRPGMLFVPIATALVIPVLWHSGFRRSVRALFVALGICALATGAYSIGYHRQTGHFGISSVQQLNQISLNVEAVRHYDMDSLPVHASLALNAQGIQDTPLFWDDYFLLAAEKPGVFYDELENVYGSHPGIRAQGIRNALIQNLKDERFAASIPLAIMPAFALLYLPVLFLRLRKHRKTAWLHTLLWLLFMGNLGVVVLGAAHEYTRLLMPVLPLLFVLGGDFAHLSCKYIHHTLQSGHCNGQNQGNI